MEVLATALPAQDYLLLSSTRWAGTAVLRAPCGGDLDYDDPSCLEPLAVWPIPDGTTLAAAHDAAIERILTDD